MTEIQLGSKGHRIMILHMRGDFYLDTGPEITSIQCGGCYVSPRGYMQGHMTPCVLVPQEQGRGERERVTRSQRHGE